MSILAERQEYRTFRRYRHGFIRTSPYSHRRIRHFRNARLDNAPLRHIADVSRRRVDRLLPGITPHSLVLMLIRASFSVAMHDDSHFPAARRLFEKMLANTDAWRRLDDAALNIAESATDAHLFEMRCLEHFFAMPPAGPQDTIFS